MNPIPPIPLSCYIRTLNEAKRIGPVIEKVIEIGAEVIVIDCGSTDGTQSIAEKAGAQVIEKKWEGNGFQKRMGEDAASNGWLLDLDADELLSTELQQEILELFTHSEPEPGVFKLRRILVPPVPKGAVWGCSAITWRDKLYHKSIARIPAHAAWDQFEIPANITPIRLKGTLLHYPFLSLEHQVQKMNRVSSVRTRETKLKGKHILALRILFAYPIYFFKKLVKQRLYRQGIYGFAFAAITASNRWLKDVKMYECILSEKGHNKIGE